MMDSISEVRLSAVMPELASRIRTLASSLAQEDIIIRVTQGLRSWSDQDKLFAQVPKVTNCRGGYSYHNFGMAVDVVPDFADTQPFAPDWNTSHPAWQRIAAIGTSLGLDSGATWRSFKDYPHLQLTGRFPEGAPDDEVRQLFKDGGMEAVWNESGVRISDSGVTSGQ